MKTAFRLANLELHAWSGVLTSLMLYVVFVAGAFALFEDQLTRWNQPQLRDQSPSHLDAARVSIDDLLGGVSQAHALPGTVFLTLPSDAIPRYRVAWRGREGGGQSSFVTRSYDLQGRPIPGSQQANSVALLDRLHRDLRLPQGTYIVGILALFLMFALLTGMVYHWRTIGRDLFQLRRQRGERRFWIDAHNVTGVVGLPFYLMYAFTGALFNLSLIYQISAGLVVYKGDQQALLEAVGFANPVIELSGVAAAPTGLEALYQKTQQRWPDGELLFVRMDGFGDRNQQVLFDVVLEDGLRNRGAVTYRLSDGAVLDDVLPHDPGPLNRMLNTTIGLHVADYDGLGLRVVYFFLGLAGALMFISGNLIWMQKRIHKRRGSLLFNRLLTRLTLAVGLGIWPAIGALFVAAQWLPWEWSDRGLWHHRVFYTTWLLAALYGGWLRRDLTQAARDLSWITALLALLIPAIHGFQTGAWLSQSLAQGNWWLAGVDLSAVCFSFGFAALALHIQRRYGKRPETLSEDLT